jgi:hypothetical protein
MENNTLSLENICNDILYYILHHCDVNAFLVLSQLSKKPHLKMKYILLNLGGELEIASGKFFSYVLTERDSFDRIIKMIYLNLGENEYFSEFPNDIKEIGSPLTKRSCFYDITQSKIVPSLSKSRLYFKFTLIYPNLVPIEELDSIKDIFSGFSKLMSLNSPNENQRFELKIIIPFFLLNSYGKRVIKIAELGM